MVHRHQSLLVVVVLLAPVALSEEAEPPQLTASQLVIDMIAEVPAANARVCTEQSPAMKADFDLALVKFRESVDAIAKRLLSSSNFAPLTQEPAPQELVDRRQVRNAARAEKLKNVDASKDCPVFLRNTRYPDEARLEVAVSEALTAVQGVIEIKKKMASQ